MAQPEQAQGHFDLDTYANAVAQARHAAVSITEESKVHLAAACSGGIVTAGLLGQLAASGELDEVASLTLMVCALDNDTEGTMSALASRDVAAAAVAESARKGCLDGQALQGVFTWLRPNDLVWNYVVNNYVLGKDPPAFDILFWNQDTVRLAAGLHRDFIHIGLDNSFASAGALDVLGQPVDLGQDDLDTYFVAGLTDHIVPWESAYNGARLFGGDRRFVLSNSGHIQALVNPPPTEGVESRASYRVADELPESAAQFLAQAPRLSGSWWSDWDN
ncbi:MAG TPA: alpha/beta fold hydrolase [Solirubrobacteraceae bacterium]|nr:alpha/beta fold hydrolase [Solirubrobacteraceae bacterium]